MLINHLPDHYKARFTDVTAKLSTAIETGVVPNVLFTEAKDVINHAFEKGAEAFLATGPHAQKHHMSDWWLGAYHVNALNVSAHTLNSTIKRASKHTGLREFVNFLHSLEQYASLLDTAKPLVRKRNELPKVKTQKQIEREADQMTCQCCGRGIFAQTSTIAHHGYERPGTGWQTASCMGAKHLPFEVSRDRLGDMIESIRHDIAETERHLRDVRNETVEVAFSWQQYVKEATRYGSGRYVNHTQHFTRASFDAVRKIIETEKGADLRGRTFDDLKNAEVQSTLSRIASLKSFLKEQQARYDGWKQTHTHFDKKAQIWICK